MRRRAVRAPPSAAAGRLALLVATAVSVAGCAGSDPQPLELVGLDGFGNQASLVAGGGATALVGYTSSGPGVIPVLRLVRHDASSPDQTVFVGDVTVGGAGSAITRLAVGDEAAALTAGGVVRLVDLSAPALRVETLTALGDARELAVAGGWVLAAVENELVLVHRDRPTTAYRFAAASTPTALLATGGAFVAFTGTGYIGVDPSLAPTIFTEVSDPAVANVRAAFADGAGAMVAGPAAAPGRSRVLRLDLAAPGAPVVIRGAEVAGAFVAFAWDGAATSVLAVHRDGDGADPASFHEGYVLREGAGGLDAAGVPLTFWSRSAQPLAAHAGRLFAVEGRGLALLRIR